MFDDFGSGIIRCDGGETADRSNSGMDQFSHPEVPGGWLCEKWDEWVQPDELEETDGECPWCARSLDTDTDRSGGGA